MNSDADVAFFLKLWTTPQVMIFVGFPNGLRITADDISRQIADQPPSEYGQALIITRKSDAAPIGECKLDLPDDSGVSETDVKLLPEYWGHGYGREIKQALVDYLFTNTNCGAVRATPNRNNIASQKMQEAVGAKRISEGTYHFPPHMREFTVDVPYIVYELTRETWRSRRNSER
jgi:RimJ/RimL family protein N-acetyltransferase